MVLPDSEKTRDQSARVAGMKGESRGNLARGEVRTMRTFLHGLFARLAPPADGDPGDDQLLAAFVASRDESAFQQIVRRHGPMIHGVCRRVLRNEADADDAFQAVFVVFLRKAEKVRPGNMLGNWLYGVAVNVARKGRELNARRKQHELAARTPVADAPGSPTPGSPDGELREVIDQELSRLPADYRAAVVACDLEGRTRREAASRLGWSEGTVASRLARARSILADRLTRRGLAVPAAGLGVALGPPSVAAIPKVALTGHSAAVETLARETVNAMWTSKVKATIAVVFAVAGLAGVGTGVVLACGKEFFARPASAAKPPPDRSVETSTDVNGQAAWMKPGAGASDADDKPGTANGGAAKPTHFVLQNPARDITIISDRDETLVEFFRRQRVMVAGITEKDFNAAAAATKPSDRIFLNYASHNGDTPMIATYGSYLRLAPLNPRLVDMVLAPEQWALVLIADAKNPEVWHAVGFTKRSSVGFFASKEKKNNDDFAPADLHFAGKK
jgi:RNA polymerase sigma factor (sigma-70 family)